MTRQRYYCEQCKVTRLATAEFRHGYTIVTCSQGHVTTREALGHFMPKNQEDVLFFAFRYALGRRTAAVSIMVTEIKNAWKRLRPGTQRQMQDEIRRFPEMYGKLGDQCDIDSWQEILNLTPAPEVI